MLSGFMDTGEEMRDIGFHACRGENESVTIGFHVYKGVLP